MNVTAISSECALPFATLSLEQKQDKVAVTKRFKNGETRSSLFKIVKEAIVGQSIHLEFSRVITLPSKDSFLNYLAFVDRYEELPGDKDCAEYVENLFCEELTQLVQDVTKEETRKLLSCKNRLLVRPNFDCLDEFYVVKFFGEGEIREFPFRVLKKDPNDPTSALIIRGEALFQVHKRPLTFTSAIDLKRYLVMQKDRKNQPIENEELLLFVDRLILSYKKRLVRGQKETLWQSSKDPTKLWFLKPCENKQVKKVRILCQKTEERGFASGFKIVQKDSTGTVTFCSLTAFLTYMEALDVPRIKLVPKRLFTTEEFQLIQHLLESSPKATIDEYEDKMLCKDNKNLLKYCRNYCSARVMDHENSICDSLRI